MGALEVALGIMATAGLFMLFGYNLPRARSIFMSVGFFTLLSGAFAGYSNWLPQMRGEDKGVDVGGDISKLSAEELAKRGEIILFGKEVGGNPLDSDVGKAQCPLCHRVTGTVIRERAPDLRNIGLRAEERMKDPRYQKPDTVQTESFPGSGRATTAVEYIAESHACPSCYVVAGFGDKGSNDRGSPMPVIHKPPIGLTIDELIAVDTYLFVKDELPPLPVEEIRKAYEKFIPKKDRPEAAEVVKGSDPAGGPGTSTTARAEDSPKQMIEKMGCAACHRIPTIDFAKIGLIGPLLIEGTNAPHRFASREYKAALKAGTAHARTPKEYVIESIMNPSAFIVLGFGAPGGRSPMPSDFANKFTYAAINKLADFLLTLNADMAIKESLDRLPQEKEGSLFAKK